MEKVNFNYQDYRDNLSDELKKESDKDVRGKLHEEAKETAEYRASKILRDDKREERIEDSKILKEEIEKENGDNLKKLEILQEQMTQYLGKFEEDAQIRKSKVDVNKYNEHKLEEGNYEKNYNKAILGMRQSAENLKMLVDFFREKLNQFKDKGFRVSFEIDKLGDYKSATGCMFYDLGFMPFTNLSDSPNAGRVRVKIHGPKHGDNEASHSFLKNFALVDVYFPADAYSYGDLEHPKKEIEDFKNEINTYLENIESVPVHKIN